MRTGLYQPICGIFPIAKFQLCESDDMSWTKSWYLERRAEEKWYRDQREWLPIELPLDLCFFFDRDEAVSGLSRDVNQAISQTARNGLPEDASPEVRQECEKFCLALAGELGKVPQFSHLLFSDIVILPWENIVDSIPAKQRVVELWLNHLRGLGDLSKHRLISMLWR
jgi:hypothetical protein